MVGTNHLVTTYPVALVLTGHLMAVDAEDQSATGIFGHRSLKTGRPYDVVLVSICKDIQLKVHAVVAFVAVVN
ncbi:MAG: hypothetical protein JWP57_3073 [Spirosoma sp.]|nr:hypothetical protein [Spirosoma sp.]